MERPNSARPKKARQVKSKVKRMLIISFDIKEMFTKNSSRQSKLSILHTTATFYGDCKKMCEDFSPNFGDKRTGCCIMTTYRITLPFSPVSFLPKTTWLLSPYTLLFSVPLIEDKTEKPPF
jgi:hypothetical protein